MKNEIIPEYINYLFDNLKEGGLKLSSSVFVDDELCDEVTQSLDKIGDEVSKILRICEKLGPMSDQKINKRNYIIDNILV